MNMPAASLKKEIEAKDEEIAAAVKKHEEFVESLQKQYEECSQQKRPGNWRNMSKKQYRAGICHLKSSENHETVTGFSWCPF